MNQSTQDSQEIQKLHFDNVKST